MLDFLFGFVVGLFIMLFVVDYAYEQDIKNNCIYTGNIDKKGSFIYECKISYHEYIKNIKD